MLNKLLFIGSAVLALQMMTIMGQAMPDPDNGLYSIINKFMLEFHKEVIKGENGNLVYSPIHAWAILYQISVMTEKTTRDELLSALHLKDANIDKDAVKRITQSIAEISLGSASYLDTKRIGLSFFIPDWIVRNNMQGNWNFGGIEVNVIDFEKTQEITNEMNDWVRSQIGPETEDIIEIDELKKDILVIMISIVLFSGHWQNEFNALPNQRFHLGDGTSKNIKMMNTKGSFRHGLLPNISAEFIELPYEFNDSSDNVSMIIIMPNVGSSLTVVEEGLNDITLSHLLTAEYGDVNLDLPKFRLESTIDVRPSHERLHIKEMYTDSANVVDHGSSRSKIAKIIQKSFIDVDEEGTNFNSMAKPFTTKRSRRSPTENSYNFRVDRPFIALICTKNVILLRATIFDPDSSMSVSTKEESGPKLTESTQPSLTPQENQDIENTTKKRTESTTLQVKAGKLLSRIRQRYLARKKKIVAGVEKIKDTIVSIFS